MMKTKLWLSFLTLIGLIPNTQTAIAQTYQPSNRTPVGDSTLNTQVSANGSTFNITGGLTKGQTLFHSFTDFSVPTNGAANFVNLTNPRDIITRVTGNSFSDINGLVNTNGANFFLINPNGIVFGTNAQLNVGRAFMASMANGLNLVDGAGNPITFGTNTNGDPLLKIAPNVLFNVSSLTMGGGNGQISNFGTLQTNNPSQYIWLIGGNVSMNGGIINAPGGRVDIGGLSAPGTVTFGVQGDAQLPTNVVRGDVSLTNGSVVNVAGAGGGDIAITARNLEILSTSFVNSGIFPGFGTPEAVAGDVKLNATGEIVGSNSGIFNNVPLNSKGNGGNIIVDAASFSLRDGAQLSTLTAGIGNAGNIEIKNVRDLNLTNSSTIRSDNSAGTGNAGNIDIKNVHNLNLTNSSTIRSDTSGIGNAGDITIKNTGDINIVGAVDSQSSVLLNSTSALSFISSNTYGKGNTGKITLDTTGDISLTNGGGIFSSIVPNSTPILDSQGIAIKAEGNGQGIEIKNVHNLNLTNFSTIQTTNFGGTGNAGDITVKTTGNINIFGADLQSTLFQSNPALLALSGISSGTLGTGDTGKITIDTTGDINLSNRGGIFSQISAPLDSNQGNIQFVRADGNSKGIEIKNARNLNLDNFSTIQSTNFGGKGDAGNIDIINIGNIKITGVDDPKSPLISNSQPRSFISSDTVGKGNTGKITIQKIGNITLSNGAGISSSILSNSSIQTFDLQGGEIKVDGDSKGIEIKDARNLNLSNYSSIRSDNNVTSGNKKNNAGNIDLTTTGDIKIDAGSFISTSTYGNGDTGKIKIGTDGDLIFTKGSALYSSIAPTANGDSKGINIIKARNLILTDSTIRADNNGGNGKSGQIKIDTTGKLALNQSVIYSTIAKNAVGKSEGIEIKAGEVNLNNNSEINTSTLGSGNAGSIQIVTQGKYTADGVGGIFAITEGDGDAGNIGLKAKSVALSGGSEIQTLSNGKGKVGDLTITTPDDGFINISGNGPSVNGKLPDGRPGGFASGLLATAEKNSSSVAGKIFLKTGTLNIENGGAISTRTRTNAAPVQPNNPKSSIVDSKYPEDPGAGSISIDAKNINITGGGQISATSTGNAPAGDIILKNASAKLIISGSDPQYEQRKAELALGFPDGYKVENIIDINSGQIVLSSDVPNYEQQKASLLAASPNGYKVENIRDWSKTEVVNFTTVPISQYSGIFANVNGATSTGKGGSVILNPFSVKISDGGQISVSNQGTGEGGNIFLTSNIATLNNGKISAESKNATGGDIKISLGDYLLLRNNSGISTNSESSGKDGNGGNITIGSPLSSPLIIALPGNNDITANASAGNGGKVTIVSQGLFGIQNRAASPFTSDITSTSTFGQSGAVNIDTPGTDPGRDSTELPNTTTDASNQISQVCSADNRQNKLTVAGRGGLPPNANDPLTSDVVWQDTRAASSQPAISSATTNPFKLPPPAVGWVFDGKGKVTLIAAATQGQPTGTQVVCPNVK